MGKAWPYLQELTRQPHRASASVREAQAAGRIAGWLHGMGLAVETQAFLAPRDTLYLGPAAVMLGFVAAAVLGVLWRPWAGLLCCALLLVPMVGELLGGAIDFDLLLPLYPSLNVIGRQPRPAGPDARTVVISAHYDTQRASWLFHPWFVRLLQPYFYMVYLSLMLIPLGLAALWLTAKQPDGWATAVISAGCALTAANAAFLLICRATGSPINGANDNGSGVALALALAERFTKRPVPGLNLVFAFTGSEEVGTRGMKQFIRGERLDPAGAFVVNLDNLGGGTLHYLTGEGMLVYRRYGRRLLHLAREMAEGCPGRVRVRRNLLLPTDGLISARAGYETITFMAFDDRGGLPDYHWYTDQADRIDRELLHFTESFLVEYVGRLAHAAVASR